MIGAGVVVGNFDKIMHHPRTAVVYTPPDYRKLKLKTTRGGERYLWVRLNAPIEAAEHLREEYELFLLSVPTTFFKELDSRIVRPGVVAP